MKNKYKNRVLKKSVFQCVLGLLFLLVSTLTIAQVKPFQQRTSSQAPGDFKNKTIYNLRGDFKMIGNTNLRVSGGSGANSETNSNTNMALVDIDGINGTSNSSSAQLVLPANCTNIVYAGLYWSGRRDNDDGAITTETNTSNYKTGSNNIRSTGLNLSISGSGTDDSGTITYTLSNSNNSVYYQFTFGTNDAVQYRASTTGTFTTIPSNQLSFNNSGNSSSGKRTVILSQPITFTIGSQVVTINNLQRRRGNPITDSDNRAVNIKVVTTTTDAGVGHAKTKVKFKKDNLAYTDLVADDYYIGGSGLDGIFTAYSDVTDYVRTNGVGNYFVANIDLSAGNGSSVGYFGGWGMIVIYENPTMKWRDITVFDGYAYMQGNNYDELPLSGFRAAQNGAVNVTMGMMAGEGDRSISGDNFRIRNAADTNWQYLSHSGNQTSGNTNSNNFFNSSILTDGTRSPSLINNTGLDIVKFDITNTGNSIIANNQTSTKFRYGSDGGNTSNRDTYVIYNIVFAVDAYVPDAEGVNLPSSIKTFDGTVLTDPSQIAYRMNHLEPNDEVTMQMKIYNYGNERIENAVIDINVPNAMRLISAGRINTTGTTHISGAGTNNFSQPGWKSPVAPNDVIPGAITTPVAYEGGVITWNLGSIPTQVLPTNASRVTLSTLTYTMRVTDNCTKLRSSNEECILSPQINGQILGTGEFSKIPLDPKFIIGYDDDCAQTPIYGFTDLVIDPSPEFLANCSDKLVGDELFLEYFCSIPTGTTIPRATIAGYYPIDTKFYSQKPSTIGYETSIINGDFPVVLTDVIDNGVVIGKETRFYALFPETINVGCYSNIHIFISQITSQPEIDDFVPVCEGEAYTLPVSLSAIGQSKGLMLAYFDSGTNPIPLLSAPYPTIAGTYTYYVAESGNNGGDTICYGDRVPFTIVIVTAPTAVNLTDLELCTFADYESIINAEGATVVWEYYNGADWVALSNQLGGVAIVSNQLKITKAPVALNGTKFRVKLTNTNNCSSNSDEMMLTVKGCQMPANPMIYTPLKREP